MRKKLILIFTLMVACLCVFAGCNQNYDEFTSDKPYNAVLYYKATEWVDEDYLEEHYSEDYSEIITSNKRLKKVYPGFDKNVNFKEKMVIAFAFSNFYANEYTLIDVKLENIKLIISLDDNIPAGSGGACDPFPCSFMVILDKLDINEVEFKDEYGGKL